MAKRRLSKLGMLISSMNKAEKRNFRQYSNRDKEASSKLFFQLFELIDKKGELEENQILAKIPNLKKSQLSNVRANLYTQILSCLRLTKSKHVVEIKIREQVDFAKVLYDKGLYRQSLDLLDKAKRLSISKNYESLVLQILYFEKRIESQHITSSISGRAKNLVDNSNELIEQIELTNNLSNLSLALYGKYLQYGYVKNKKDYLHITEYFQDHLPDLRFEELSFYQSLYLCQAHVWYNNMCQNFAQYYKYSNRWLDLFHKNPNAKFTETPLYLKGIQNVLNALFMAQKEEMFLQVFEELKNFDLSEKPNATDNDHSLYMMILYVHSLNATFLSCQYDVGARELTQLENDINENKYNWDLNRMMVFYYKIGCVYFGDRQCEKALDYLNLVNNNYYPGLREDIQCFSRILSLIVHFDLGNTDLVSYQLRQVYRFLLKLEELDSVLIEILAFLRRTPQMQPDSMSQEFRKLKTKLIMIKEKRFEKRPFLYLDIISWLDSKIQNTTFQNILMSQREERLIDKNEDNS